MSEEQASILEKKEPYLIICYEKRGDYDEPYYVQVDSDALNGKSNLKCCKSDCSSSVRKTIKQHDLTYEAIAIWQATPSRTLQDLIGEATVAREEKLKQAEAKKKRDEANRVVNDQRKRDEIIAEARRTLLKHGITNV